MRRSARLSLPVWIVGALLSVEAVASAEPVACPAPAEGSAALEEVDAATRLSFLRATMDDQAARSATWRASWLVMGSFLVAYSFTSAGFASNPTDRANDIVGGSTAILIPVPILLSPPRVLADRATLDARIAQGGDICATLARAEELLARDAEDQAKATGVFAHATSIGFNVAIGLVLGLGFADWKGAASVGGVGVLIGEGEILSHPRGAIHALDRYRQGDLSSSGGSRAWFIAPLAAPSGGGAQLVLSF
jgi:hypothetical protein